MYYIYTYVYIYIYIHIALSVYTYVRPQALRHIMERTGAIVVLSSEWRRSEVPVAARRRGASDACLGAPFVISLDILV